MTVEVLNRTKGLIENISPTGTKYVVEPWPTNPALYRIRSTNKTGPEVVDLAGHFTGAKRAQTVLTKYLLEQWEMSDNTASKMRREKSVA